MLNRRDEPPFHVQHNPCQIRVLLHCGDDLRVRNVVEEPLDIEIDHPGVPPAPLLAHLHRVQRRLSWTITVGIGVEHWIHVRLQDHGHGCLCYPVGDSGHSEDPCATIWLRDGDGFHWLREIAPRRHPVPELEQVVPKILFKFR